MAAGDIAFQAINMSVLTNDSDRSTGTPKQRVVFGPGTTMVPTTTASIDAMVSVPLVRALVGGQLPPTLFDSTKLYKLTIEEV
jgi:hypothetical protein